MEPTTLRGVLVRPLEAGDDLFALTALLHRAYGQLAERGMRFLASHQSEAVTRERCTGPRKDCYLAEAGGRVVGTITLRGPGPCPLCPYYERPDVCVAGQLGVEPAWQSRGIARLLMDRVEARARERGFAYLAGDTSEHAHELIAWYTRRGFERVGFVQWDVTNYRSVLLSKPLASAPV